MTSVRKRIGTLKTVEDIVDECRRIYRDSRNERLDMPTGKGLVWMLKEMSHMMRLNDIEKRLEVLEDEQNLRA